MYVHATQASVGLMFFDGGGGSSGGVKSLFSFVSLLVFQVIFKN